MTIRKLSALTLAFLASGTIVFAFQNCGPKSFQTINGSAEVATTATDPDTSAEATPTTATPTPTPKGSDEPQCKDAPNGLVFGEFKITGTTLNQTESGTVDGGNIKSFPFILNANTYVNGATFFFESGNNSGAYNPKDFSISRCPGVFDGLFEKCTRFSATGGAIHTSHENTANLCYVPAGVRYYFNMRPSLQGQDAAAFINPMPR